jgi:predicted heme/steroid binding protein
VPCAPKAASCTPKAGPCAAKPTAFAPKPEARAPKAATSAIPKVAEDDPLAAPLKQLLELEEKLPDVRKVAFVKPERLSAKALAHRQKIKADTLDIFRKHEFDMGGAEGSALHRSEVTLPADHKKNVGVLTLDGLAKFGCESKRKLVSVYGVIYDVSSCPDKYGSGGKFSNYTGKDMTWALITGTESDCNTFFDMFKRMETLTQNIRVLCRWQAAYEKAYGEPVGSLSVYNDEDLLPAHPAVDPVGIDCVVM